MEDAAGLTVDESRSRRVAWSLLRVGAPALVVWLAAGAALAQVTGRIADWFLMTDELYYERLALSIARSGSPLPRLHGVSVPNVDQLLPLLLAPLYRGALVPDALHRAHVFDAFVLASAAVPAFLLAWRLTRSRRLAAGVALLSVAVPWSVYAGMLLTEVVAYPAFLWGVLGIQAALASPRARNDVLALVGIAVATLARTQLLVLVLVLPLAFLAHAATSPGPPRERLRRLVAEHRVLTGVYAALAVAAAALAATGRLAHVLGTYRAAGRGDLLPPHTARSLAEHLAVVALGLGVLPFLVGAGWALARLVRRHAGERAAERSAFAAVFTTAVVLLTIEVTSFDLRYTGYAVSDRYLFYLVPLVLAACAAAFVDPPWPRWAIAVPAAVVALGFSGLQMPSYAKLNLDRPLSVVYERIVEFAGSQRGAHWLLAVATLVVAVLFVEAGLLLRRRWVAAAVAVVVAVALPAETGAAFTRLFATNGTSGRPLTLPQGGVFDWIDRTVGPGAAVTMVSYPIVPGDYWAGTAYWWDVEFWNASVVRDAVYRGRFFATASGFPKLVLAFDPRTGRASRTGSRYVAQAVGDARFRIAGTRVVTSRGVDLIDATRPWRAAWVSSGLYDDGWSRPGRTATVRVFARPDQRGAVTRTLTVRLRAPDGPPRPYRVAGGGDVASGEVGTDTVDAPVNVCVPAGGSADVRLTASGSSAVYGDPQSSVTFGQPRQAGVQVVQIALADEIGGPCEPSGR